MGSISKNKQQFINLVKTKLGSSGKKLDQETAQLTDEEFVRACFLSPSQFYRKNGFRLNYNGKELITPFFENWSIKLTGDHAYPNTRILMQLDRIFTTPWYIGGQSSNPKLPAQVVANAPTDPFIIVFDADISFRLKLNNGDLGHFLKMVKKS